MPIKECIRTCKCKECGKEIKMFLDKNNKLIFFPENTVRPAYGIFELSDHVRHAHKNLYDFLILAKGKHDMIIGLFDIA